MPPLLALSIWFVLLLLLFRFDPAQPPETSWTLWIPITWMFFVASRLPSQWLGRQSGTVATALEEGNALDRTIWFALLVLALGILLSRSLEWGDLIARNLALVVYISFAFLSIVWSDFAFVAFKRWIRDLGTYLMVLIILSDHCPAEALRTFLRRLCYLTIPLSIILVKYFPAIGRTYEEWTGLAIYVGVTTSKNMLGVACLVSGMFFFWDAATHWCDRHHQQTRRLLTVDIAFILMTLYLLRLSHSATSALCLGIGWLVIALARSRAGERHTTLVKALIPVSFVLYVILGFGLGLNATLAEMVGRDPTLTDRTRIWSILFGLHTNPLVGTGYESFWLGSRLDVIQQKGAGAINEAHNGYLEVYLNLGAIGLLLLIVFIASAYRTICNREFRDESFSLTLGLMTVVLFYNLTEAAFKHGLMWCALLLGGIVVSRYEEDLLPSVKPSEKEDLEQPTNDQYPEWGRGSFQPAHWNS